MIDTASFPLWHRRGTRDLYDSHNLTRGMDLMEGGMIGAGSHVQRDGGAVADYSSNLDQRRLGGIFGVVTKAFTALFGGKGVDFEALPKLGKKCIPTSAVSKNLGNPPHYDKKDGHRGYAMWIADGMMNQVSSWWFVLPMHGIAVELCDGVIISWNGSEVMHCSSVPCASCDVYSVWCSVPKSVLKRHAVDEHCKETLALRAKRCAPSESQRVQFAVGDKCLLLWRSGTSKVRSYDVAVDCVFGDGRVRVREKGQGGSMVLCLTAHQVQTYLTKKNG